MGGRQFNFLSIKYEVHGKFIKSVCKSASSLTLKLGKYMLGRYSFEIHEYMKRDEINQEEAFSLSRKGPTTESQGRANI